MHAQVKLVWMLVAVLVVIGLLEVAVGAAKTRGDFSTLELCSGAQAGISIGAGNSAISAGLKITSLPSLAPLLVVGGIGLTVAGIVFSAAQARGASTEPAVRTVCSRAPTRRLCSQTAATPAGVARCSLARTPRSSRSWPASPRVIATAPPEMRERVVTCVGHVAGIFVLEESWPQDRLKSNLRAASLVLSFGGVLLLNWRTITGGADKATVDQREMVQRSVAVKDRRAMH